MDIGELLRAAVKFKASDLHIQVGSSPSLRIDGDMTPLDTPSLTLEEVEDLVRQITDPATLEQFHRERSADFAYDIRDVARFRVSAFYERGQPSLCLRQIPCEVPSLDTLDLPEAVADIARCERGLVLVTGTTGSGKSTTLAAVIDFLNQTRRLRIITIEDPVEFVHRSRKCLIAQREVGHDTPGFSESLRRALRQDPDFILVGELRDAETMRVALQAADTGHLVFSTMHTTNASMTIQRLVTMFPIEEREALLMQLSTNLEAVISQRLARKRAGGRIPVVEIMRSSPIVRKIILEGRIGSLPQAIANRESGMQLFDQHLAELCTSQIIRTSEALRLATNPEALEASMRGISRSETAGGLVL
ncbi:MAG: PilT/PilU family type 4a pilus ATPase [bacterium]|nr:PilT/PilU family type 4a pilus ATPase [bacterium]